MLKDEEGGDFKKLKWQLKQKSGKYPQKRWSHSGIVLNNYLYIYGGKSEVEELREPVYRINCDTCECQTMDSAGMPLIRESHSCSVINNSFYVWGGCLNSTQKVLNDWLQLKLHGKYIQWKTLEQKNQIQARESHSSLVLDEKNILIFGGCGVNGEDQLEQYFADFWIYNLQTNLWNQITKISGDIDIRHGCSLNFIKNEIYLFGGGGVQDNVYYNDLFKLTFEHTNFNDWNNFPELKIEKVEINGIKPSARQSHACVEYKNRYIIVIGGEGLISHRKSLLGDVWCYDTQSRSWQELLIENRSTFKPRANFSACLYKNSIFVFGGLTNFQRQQYTCSNQLFELCLNSSKSAPKSQSKTYICNVCKFQMKQKPHNHNNHSKHKVFQESKPENTFFASFSLVSKIASSISHPIEALSLIVGSQSYLSASLQKKCKIQYLIGGRRSQQIQIEAEPVLRIRLQGLSLNKHSFGLIAHSYEYIPIQSISFQKLSYHSTENQQKLWKYFSFKLKNACSRLGSEFLLGFVSSEGILSLVLCNKMGIYQTNISQKNLIEQEFQTKMHTKIIKQYMSHCSIEINDFKPGQITLHISSLTKMSNSQKYELQVNAEQDDIITRIINNANIPCQFSLRKYLKYYFLEEVNLKVEIQKKPAPLLSLQKQLKKWKQLDHSGEIQSGKLQYEEDIPGNIKIYHRNRCLGEIVRFIGVKGYISLRNEEQLCITSTKMTDSQKLTLVLNDIINQFLELKRKRDPSSSIIELQQQIK